MNRVHKVLFVSIGCEIEEAVIHNLFNIFQVAERLERQEDEVRRLVREALASLPDNLESDSKLLVPSLEELQLRPKNDASSTAEDKCSSLDRLMCNIVDAL